MTDPTIPFARVLDRLHAADVVFANSFVRHTAQNETIARPIAAEQEELDQLRRLSTHFAPALEVEGDEVVVWPTP